MTTTFIEFTKARKEQIDHMRTRLMTERPYKTVYATIYITRHNPLSLVDYAVYAALRGADYRKGDHTGGRIATAVLKDLIRSVTYWGTSPASTGSALRAKYIPEGQTVDDIMAFKAVLESEVAKWENAQ